MVRSLLKNPWVVFISRVILGGLFIYASWDKAIHPLGFAQIIHNYRVTPPSLINIAAVILPWIELLAGALLILGYRARGANLVIFCLLIFYMALLSVTAIRGVNVSCGCFTTSMAVKSNLVIRTIEDALMLFLAVHIFLCYKENRRRLRIAAS